MANYSVWNVRKRHEWLATPLKKKRIKKRAALRIGLFDAWARNKTTEDAEAAAGTEEEPAAAESTEES